MTFELELVGDSSQPPIVWRCLPTKKMGLFSVRFRTVRGGILLELLEPNKKTIDLISEGELRISSYPPSAGSSKPKEATKYHRQALAVKSHWSRKRFSESHLSTYKS